MLKLEECRDSQITQARPVSFGSYRRQLVPLRFLSDKSELQPEQGVTLIARRSLGFGATRSTLRRMKKESSSPSACKNWLPPRKQNRSTHNGQTPESEWKTQLWIRWQRVHDYAQIRVRYGNPNGQGVPTSGNAIPTGEKDQAFSPFCYGAGHCAGKFRLD